MRVLVEVSSVWLSKWPTVSALQDLVLVLVVGTGVRKTHADSAMRTQDFETRWIGATCRS